MNPVAAEAVSEAHRGEGAADPDHVRAPRIVVRRVGTEPAQHDVRYREPVTLGLPLPERLCGDARLLRLQDHDGRGVPLQARALERWPGGTIKWVLLDFQASTPADGAAVFQLVTGGEPAAFSPTAQIRVTESEGSVAVDTGAASFEIAQNAFPFARVTVNDRSPLVPAGALRIRTSDGTPCQVRIRKPSIVERGSLRTTVVVDGTICAGSGRCLLDLIARLHFFLGLATVRIDLTLRNPKRAVHRGGFWELGDPGSVFLKDAVVEFSVGSSVEIVQCSPELGSAASQYAVPFEIYQDSSGGEHWQSANHVNRDGRIPVGFRGYRIRAADHETSGLRASPVVAAIAGNRQVAIATEYFWQNFPRSVEVTGDRIALGLLPAQFGDVHEIQGGEQKTHRFAVAFGDEGISSVPLDWVRSPVSAHADPQWYAATDAVPYLWPESDDPNSDYVDLVRAGIEGSDAFEKKREVVDEFGWRHFGDIYADHEAQRHAGPAALVSHYNNQYDAVKGFASQFLRTGDHRWWMLMHELALHAVDIDIYHTEEDKSAYNGGPFWHTVHYTHAGRATHRSFPRAKGTSGGGPSAQHNYTTGLVLHYLLTGNEASKEAALGLARWVVDMDDGRKSVFRWLDRGFTGLATEGPFSYQGPTRAGANSLDALVDAHRLSGEPAFLAKAEQLIRRCVHPADDLRERDLSDVEHRWSYLVFLAALGRYLDHKIEDASYDFMYAYARQSLLHYAAWMAVHEYPYLSKPDVLEFPTETWAAQDIRKSEVFTFAAKHAPQDQRPRLLERADFFFQSSTSELKRMPTRTLARPVVLLLTRGSMHAYVQRRGVIHAPPPAEHVHFGAPDSFVTQKARALRRAVVLVAASTAAVLSAAVWWFLG